MVTQRVAKVAAEAITGEMSPAERQALIEELVASAEPAPEPKAVQEDGKPASPVVLMSGSGAPDAAVVTGGRSVGYVWMVRANTGKRVRVPLNMVRQKLALRQKNGTQAWYTTWNKPAGLEYRVGKVTCLLHPSRPERAAYDALGLPVCHKATMMNEMAARLHTQNRHNSSWQVIQETKKTVREDATHTATLEMLKAVRDGVAAPQKAPRSPEQIEQDRARMAKMRAKRTKKAKEPQSVVT